MPLPFHGQQDLSTFERVGKNLAVLPVHQHDPLRVAAFDKPNEVVVARVRAEVELLPLALDVDRDAVQINHAFFHEAPAVRAFDLVAGPEDRAARVLADHVQVAQDGSSIEHPARRDDHLPPQRHLAFRGSRTTWVRFMAFRSAFTERTYSGLST